MNLLVVGGAGYIGSHVVKQLIEVGHSVVVLDNLQTGHVEAVHKNAAFIKGDIRDKDLLRNIFSLIHYDLVFHFAACSSVAESIKDPLMYFDNNVSGLITLLQVMNEFGIKHIVFSSTAAVYGNCTDACITEEAETTPESPYGESKLMMEKIIENCRLAYDINYVVLRYFNVAGADLDGELGEDHHPETHLVPLILKETLKKEPSITLFGTDYHTKDGSTIRDYIHVVDLASAHLSAMNYLIKENQSNTFNVGSSSGFSTLEIINHIETYTNTKIAIVYGKRRIGDPHSLVASNKKISHFLDWSPQFSNLDTIISSAWSWHQNHPNGYQPTHPYVQ